MSGDQLNLDDIEAVRLIACDDGPDLTWHQRQDATWALLDVNVPALVAEVRRLREDVEVLRAALDR